MPFCLPTCTTIPFQTEKRERAAGGDANLGTNVGVSGKFHKP